MKLLAITTLLMLAACNPKPIPIWNGKLYVGNKETRSLERKQENESISSDSDKFDTMIAMSDEDFRSFYTTYVLGCKDWGNVQLSTITYRKNKDVVEKFISQKEKK